MKRFFLGTFLVLLTATLIHAQDYKKQLKNANKTLSKYFLDPVANKADLNEALAILDQVFSIEEAKANPEAWITKGEIFNEIAKAEMNKKVLDTAYELGTPQAGLMALDAFNKAMSLASKKSHTKDALEGIRLNEDFTNNIAITHFQAQDYDNAFTNFIATLNANKILKENNMASRIDDPAIKHDQIFYTAVSGYFGKNKDASIPLFEELYKAGKAQPLVYEALFTVNSDTNIEKAMEYLNAGREANPDDNGLLFAEINYYLKVGKLNILTDKLKAAIEKEPDNVSVYNTLGNVYDQLNQGERAKDNLVKAEEYFKLAFSYFEQALAKDPKSFDAIYSQGALYYNKAASMTAKLNELSNDYSSAGTKKYNAIKAEMDGYFAQALPYFLKAESLNPKDQNTLIALKEIYAREGNLEKSASYKVKLESIQK
ncbi:MAG: tetratricopeptide repeat protein [Saprospiraceae bacterium]|jgi:Flp pilus assembly protein TadD|nr:tetratricopeptide repeat protein [Saprospiraceae bacterium]MBL0025136.1 tetratricopeptide repeat protein [Saprospiraceae bacterium]